MVAMNESIRPITPTSTAMAAAIPSAVRPVRRGARSTLRNGIWVMVEPGRCTSHRDRPPPGVRWVVRMASTGAMRSVWRNGRMQARSGMTNPSAAPRRNTAGWKSVIQTGMGMRLCHSEPRTCWRMRPRATPATAPPSATWAPNSTGRTAIRLVGTPMAMPMPNSRRCAVRIRPTRLNAANAAPNSTITAKMLKNRWSPPMSSYIRVRTGSSVGSITVNGDWGNAAPTASSSAAATPSESAPGARSTNMSLTCPSRPDRRCTVGRGANTTAWLAWASRPPSRPMIMKYSGDRTRATTRTRSPPPRVTSRGTRSPYSSAKCSSMATVVAPAAASSAPNARPVCTSRPFRPAPDPASTPTLTSSPGTSTVVSSVEASTWVGTRSRGRDAAIEPSPPSGAVPAPTPSTTSWSRAWST